MAEFNMWGPEQSGSRMAARDQQASLLNDLGAVETAGKIGMQPAQRSLLESHARLYGAEAQEKEALARMRQAIPEKMSQLGASGSDPDSAAYRRNLGKVLLDSGYWEQGRHLIEGADMSDARKAEEVARKATTAKTQLETQAIIVDQFGKLANGVTDQASLEGALIQGSQMAAGITDPAMRARAVQMLSRIPTNYAEAAPVLESLKAQTIKAGDQIRLDLRERDVQTREEVAKVRESLAESRKNLQDTQVLLNEARKAKLDREGARPPDKKREVEPARDYIKSQLQGKLGFGQALASADLNSAAEDLADNANRLRQRNPALTYEQSVAQAFDPTDWIGGRSLTSPMEAPHYAKPGETAKRAMPLVQNPEVGKWYKNSSGVSKKFQGFDPGGKSKWDEK